MVEFSVELKLRAVRDLKRLPPQDALRITDALQRLKIDLAGDVKKLVNRMPRYRLRVGTFRVLFEIEDEARIVVYSIDHRREAYR